jgi:hypothetical protein
MNWVKPFSKVAGSSESVVEPWPSPARNVPPFFGSAASALLSIEVTAAAETPSAVVR